MAMLAGIGERLRNWVGPAEGVRAETHGRARVIAVAAQKGGVGKTTTAVHLASTLALHQGLHVLLVDLDAQGHVASSLRAHLRTSAEATMSQVLLGRGRDLVEAALPTTLPGLHVTAADRALAETEALLATRIGRELQLRTAAQRARARYDAIVIDCPPNLGLLTVNALCAADHVLVPSDLSILALEGVDHLFSTLNSLEAAFGRAPSVLGVLLTRVDSRNASLNETIRRAATDRYGKWLLDTEIATNTALCRAQLKGQVVFQCAPNSPGSRDYRSLGAEVAERICR